MLPTATKSTTLCSVSTFKQWLGVKSNATKVVASLSAIAAVATASCTAHGFLTNTIVLIAGATQSAYNGSFLVTVIDANTFTYTMASSPTSPATGSSITATPDDARYAALADAATADLENTLSLYFVKRSVSTRFSGDGKCTHALEYAPVASIDSFTIGGVAVDASTYVLDTQTGIIEFTSGGFTCGTQNIAITYTAGYDVQDGTSLPSDIVRAGLDLGKAMHDELVSNAIAATTVSLGPATMVVKVGKYPPSVQRVIDNYEGMGYRA